MLAVEINGERCEREDEDGQDAHPCRLVARGCLFARNAVMCILDVRLAHCGGILTRFRSGDMGCGEHGYKMRSVWRTLARHLEASCNPVPILNAECANMGLVSTRLVVSSHSHPAAKEQGIASVRERLICREPRGALSLQLMYTFTKMSCAICI